MAVLEDERAQRTDWIAGVLKLEDENRQMS